MRRQPTTFAGSVVTVTLAVVVLLFGASAAYLLVVGEDGAGDAVAATAAASATLVALLARTRNDPAQEPVEVTAEEPLPVTDVDAPRSKRPARG